MTALSCGLRAWAAEPQSSASVDFSREVRPILSENCFKCHGPDEGSREARLRLDVRDQALRPAKSGALPIVPGHPEQSEIIARITDRHDAMPPEETGKKLKPSEIETLRRWIAEGAPFAAHWAFVPPARPTAPTPKLSGWARTEIDRFVLARLERAGLRPAAEADKPTLLRRAAFDLTGLPPSPEAVAAFLADHQPDAFERAVDRLLASHHYGERMAAEWLDAARYADSNGFFRDNTRQAWPWRDWVIQAFNRNQRYDQFTIDQLAGDLLPQPTQEQTIATGFNRNHMVTGETGIIDEEYRVEYVADRLETTSTVWLGMTVGCARCHDHKYDPVSQKEYYQLFAFFNNSVEKGLVSPDDPPPVMDVTSPQQRAELDRLTTARKKADTAFTGLAEPLRPQIDAWEKTATSELPLPVRDLVAQVDFEPESGSASAETLLPRAVEKGGAYYEPGLIGHSARFDGMQHFELPAPITFEGDRPWTVGVWVKSSTALSCILSKIQPSGDRRGFEVVWTKGVLQINLVNRWVTSAIEVTNKEPIRRSDWTHLVISYDGSGKAAGVSLFADGLPVALTALRDSLRGPITNAEPVRIGRRDSGLGFYGQLDELRIFGRAVPAGEARGWYWGERLRGVFAVEPAKRDARQKKFVVDYYVAEHAGEVVREAHRAAGMAREAEEAFRARLPKTLVMAEVAKPRPTHVLKRGQYDAPGEQVDPDVPAALPALPLDLPRNRLGFARWLTDSSHPLTARVAVNRLWMQGFGEGLVATLNDFGLQGELPSHPELLDWLATEFVASGWDMKRLLKLIVTSATYRQSSSASAELLERDPENRLLARGPRFRLPAEMIRDQALAVSGLLIDKVGGPPVKPYQPPGLWEAVSYNGELSYVADEGEGLWRRTVYSHWKRTAPPPGVLVFDGPTRETCVVRRPRTNTPLQALLLLNDETYVEAARVLAASVLSSTGASVRPEATVKELFRRATVRGPDKNEIATLRGLYERQRTRFTAEPGAAKKLIGVGRSDQGRGLNPVELAAWTIVAQAILNLDEVVVRR